MFPPIALFSCLIILVGQIPGYSASGEASSSTAEHHNTFKKVQELLYPDAKPGSRDYRETIELAREIAHSMESRGESDERTIDLLHKISHLSLLEEQSRLKTGIQCDYGTLGHVVEVRATMDELSEKNQFRDEAAKHPLNKMINDLTDILFKSCSEILNRKVEELIFSVPANEAQHEVKLALINLYRFQKFLKRPQDQGNPNYPHVLYSYISLRYEYIDENTQLEPEDLEFLEVPQENTLSRHELLERLFERTCEQIDKDQSASALFHLARYFIYNAHDIYLQTGKEYFFRPEFGHYNICSLVPLKMFGLWKNIR